MWKLFRIMNVVEGEEVFLCALPSIDDVRAWIATRAQDVGAPKIVERHLDDGRYHLVVRTGAIGTFQSLYESEYYEAREQRAVVLTVPPASLGATGT